MGCRPMRSSALKTNLPNSIVRIQLPKGISNALPVEGWHVEVVSDSAADVPELRECGFPEVAEMWGELVKFHGDVNLHEN